MGQWREVAEWVVKGIFVALFIFVGQNWVSQSDWGLPIQLLFWPVFLGLGYWLVIRDIHFRRPAKPVEPTGSLRIRFDLHGGEFGTEEERTAIHRFTDRIAGTLSESGVGAYDGDEFGGHSCILFMYGRDPERILKAIAPLLDEAEFLEGAVVSLTAPGETAPFRRVVL